MEELKEVVEISELIIANKKDVEEFEFFYAFNVLQLVVLTVDLLHSEVESDIIQIA